jgi:hypothetical protein
VEDGFEVPPAVRILEYELSKSPPVEPTLLIEYATPEFLHDRTKTRLTGSNHIARYDIRIDYRYVQALEASRHGGLAACNTTGKPDDQLWSHETP